MTETGKTDEAINAKTGWPERYSAVIFTAQRHLSSDEKYEINAAPLRHTAHQEPGLPGGATVRGGEGTGPAGRGGGAEEPSTHKEPAVQWRQAVLAEADGNWPEGHKSQIRWRERGA